MRTLSLIVAFLLVWSGPSLAQATDEPLLDVNQHDVLLQFDPVTRLVRIEDTITTIGHERLDFALAKWLRIDDARRDGKPVQVQRSGVFRLIALGNRGPHKVQLKISGKVPVLPKNRARASGAFASAEGSFLPNYSEWMAVNPGERISYRLTVNVPKPFRAVATGRLEGEREADGRSVAVFSDKAGWPPTVFVGPYTVAEKPLKSLRIRTYFPKSLEKLAPSYLEAAAGYLSHFEALIGPYPQPEFHIVSAPVPVGLGFPNLTYIGERILPLPFIRKRSLAHEVVHAWLGNGVGVDYETGNWSEGLTTYLADYGLTEARNPTKAWEMRLGWLRDYAALPAKRDTSLEAFRTRGHDASQVVGYDKAAFLFHMLKQEVGKAAFDKGLRTLWRDYKDKVAGWRELRGIFETVSGKGLDWFFEQWVERVGAPSIRLADPKIEREDGAQRLEFTLVQQTPVYRLSVPVVLETGSDTIRKSVRLEKRAQRFSFELSGPIKSLSVDPAHNLFRRLAPGEAAPILRDVTLSNRVTAIVASQDKEIQIAARKLARRLADGKFSLRTKPGSAVPSGPVMIIGAEVDTAAFLKRNDLPPRPQSLAGKGSGRAWVVRRGEKAGPLLIVEARDTASLAALVRPLPHYKKQSFIVFDGRKAIDRGVWPAKASPLTVTFD